MKHNMIMIIGSIIIAAIITVLWLFRRRRRELPPLTLRIMLLVRSMIRHTWMLVKKRALRPLYHKRLREALAEMASEREPIKLSDLESTFSEDEETKKELLILMN